MASRPPGHERRGCCARAFVRLEAAILLIFVVLSMPHPACRAPACAVLSTAHRPDLTAAPPIRNLFRRPAASPSRSTTKTCRRPRLRPQRRRPRRHHRGPACRLSPPCSRSNVRRPVDFPDARPPPAGGAWPTFAGGRRAMRLEWGASASAGDPRRAAVDPLRDAGPGQVQAQRLRRSSLVNSRHAPAPRHRRHPRPDQLSTPAATPTRRPVPPPPAAHGADPRRRQQPRSKPAPQRTAAAGTPGPGDDHQAGQAALAVDPATPTPRRPAPGVRLRPPRTNSAAGCPHRGPDRQRT